MSTNNLGSAMRQRGARDQLLWLRLLLVTGAFLLCLILPWLASAPQLTLLIGLAGVLVALLIFMRWPPVGLLALVVVALIVPSPKLPGGLNSAVLFLAALCGLWLLDVLLGRRGARPAALPAVRPLLALIVVTLLAFGIGQLRWFHGATRAPLDTQLGGVAIFVLAPGAFALVAYRLRSLRWLQWLTWIFLAIGALHVTGWFVPLVGPVTERLLQAGTANNAMFWVWLIALAFSQALLNRQLRVRWRLCLMLLVVAAMYVCFVKLYDWKSGWMPCLTAVGAILVLRYMGRRWWIGLMLLMTAIVPAIYLSENAISSDAWSYSSRLDAWKSVLEMARINPVTGFGPANYPFYTRFFAIGQYVGIHFNSHNQYVDIIAQTGILGLACVVWFFGEIIRLGWRLRNIAPAGFAQAYVYGALGGIAGTLIAGMLVDWFLPQVYNVGLVGFRASMLAWMFMGGLVSIDQMIRAQPGSSTVGDTLAEKGYLHE